MIKQINISSIEIIGAMVYRTMLKLNENQEFLDNLVKYKFSDIVTSNGKLHLWHFPGTMEEIAATMQYLGQHQKGQSLKFPAFLNFQQIYENLGKVPGQTEIKYSLAIASLVDDDWTTEQRDENLFRYLLQPIYNEFMRQLGISRLFAIPPSGIKHTRIRVFNKGAAIKVSSRIGESTPEVIKALYGDYMDFIQLSNFTLNLLDNSCIPVQDLLREQNQLVTKEIKNILQL